jgi:hypothetical protein
MLMEEGVWSAWRTLLADNNYNSYSPTLTGTGASGNWSITSSWATNSTQLNGQAGVILYKYTSKIRIYTCKIKQVILSLVI